MTSLEGWDSAIELHPRGARRYRPEVFSVGRSRFACVGERHGALAKIENFGVMRQVSRFVRQQTGTLETDRYERMRRTSRRDPNRWPLIQILTSLVPHVMEPPGSWGLVPRRCAGSS